MTISEKALTAIVERLVPVLQAQDQSDYLVVATMLRERLTSPHAYVTVCGETSTGKSSLINGLFQRSLLPVAASPTTATVTHVVCQEEVRDCFSAMSLDGNWRDIDRQRFVELSRAPGKDLLRLQVRAAPVDKCFIGFQVFDTPGYNALLAEHEEVLRAFLPQSDVVLFVAGYRTGFGQVDQDLLEVIRASLEGRDDVPIMIVVNRAPKGTTGGQRISEIVSNARDCLSREPRLFIVEAATSPDPAVPPFPCSLTVWDAIVAEVSKPEAKQTVLRRLQQLTVELLENTALSLERKRLLLSAKASEIAEMQEQLDVLRVCREQSLAEVEKTVEHLQTTLPRLVDRFSSSLKKDMSLDICNSNKWLGAHECAEWIGGHAMPFAIRKAASSVEEQIAQELDRLNQELEEIANTAIEKIRCSTHIRSDAAEKFAQNLAWTIGKRLGGSVVENVLKGLGGVGGLAAGAGNLAKMAVSNLGKVFGKTFSRDVYTQIGRVFTKRAMTRFNAIFAIVVEAVVYLHHTSTWQENFNTKTSKAIDDWAEEVKIDLKDTCIPDIESINAAGIRTIYDDLINQDLSEIMEKKKMNNIQSSNIETYIEEVNCLLKIINKGESL